MYNKVRELKQTPLHSWVPTLDFPSAANTHFNSLRFVNTHFELRQHSDILYYCIQHYGRADETAQTYKSVLNVCGKYLTKKTNFYFW